MTFMFQTCKVAYFTSPFRFPALGGGRSRAQAEPTSNFCVTLMRPCAIPILSLLMASLFMLVSLPAVAQDRPQVGIGASDAIIGENETAEFFIFRDNNPPQPLEVTIAVSDPGSAISETVATTHTILANQSIVYVDIPTQNIDADSVITLRIGTSDVYDIIPILSQISVTVENDPLPRVDVLLPQSLPVIANGEIVEFTLKRTMSNINQSLDVRVNVDDLSSRLEGYVAVLGAGQYGYGDRTVRFEEGDSDTTIKVRTLNVPASQISNDSPALISVRALPDTASPINYNLRNFAIKTVAVNGNPNASSTLDNTAPMVTSVMRQTPGTSPTNANSLTWRVTFSETVSNVDDADFVVTGTTATISNVAAVSGNPLAWDVTASDGNLPGLNGTVTPQLHDRPEYRRRGGQRADADESDDL